MVPLLVSVPETLVTSPLSVTNVPLLVTLMSVVLVLMFSMMPEPEEVKLPLLTVAPFN